MVLVCLKHISLIKKNYVGNCKNTSNLKKIPHITPSWSQVAGLLRGGGWRETTGQRG